MLRLLFANSSSYTGLVCIASLLQRKANWQEKKGLFLASFPHLHSRRQSCFKPNNYPQFITVMTIVRGKEKKSSWTGLTSYEGVSAEEITLRLVSPPAMRPALREHWCPILSFLKGLPFHLLSHCIPAVCLHLPQAALRGLPSCLVTGLAPCHCCRAAGASQLLFIPTMLLHPAQCWFLPPGAWHIWSLLYVCMGVFFCWRTCWWKGHSCNLSLCKPRPLNLMGLHESPRKWGLHLCHTWSSEEKKKPWK